MTTLQVRPCPAWKHPTSSHPGPLTSYLCPTRSVRQALTCVERLLAICPDVVRFRTEPLGGSNDSADSAVLSMPPLSGACEMLMHVASSFRGHFGACMVAQLHEVGACVVCVVCVVCCVRCGCVGCVYVSR